MQILLIIAALAALIVFPVQAFIFASTVLGAYGIFLFIVYLVGSLCILIYILYKIYRFIVICNGDRIDGPLTEEFKQSHGMSAPDIWFDGKYHMFERHGKTYKFITRERAKSKYYSI